MPDRRFWDGLMFGFTASLTLFSDAFANPAAANKANSDTAVAL